MYYHSQAFKDHKLRVNGHPIKLLDSATPQLPRTSRSTRPSSALMLATIMYLVSYTFAENMAIISEYFNLYLLEAWQNINKHTMLLVIWLQICQIVIRFQCVNNNCVALLSIAFTQTYTSINKHQQHTAG